MSETYDAVVFDMDGVLLEGRGTAPWIYEAAAERALSEFGVEYADDHLETLGRPSYTDAMIEPCRDLGVDPERFWRSREREASAIERDRLREGARTPYDDVDALDDLAGCDLGIVSNNRHETVSDVVDLFDLGIDAYRGRDPTIEGYRRRKPDSYYLDETLDELGARDALYVGDRASDVEAAANAGIDAAFLRREHDDPAAVDVEPRYACTGLTDLVAWLD